MEGAEVQGPGEVEGQGKVAGSRWKRYHTIWACLFLAWMFCYIDRSLTGPVVSWMIQNKVSYFADVAMPYAIGGIIGSMFFAGYMLTQYPAGYLGDRYGSKVMVVISTAWAGVMTGLTAFSNSLLAFVTTRVATGLGEGAYYSNDRALIALETPAHKKSMGMGVVFVGLGVGLTIATVLTPYILDASAALWGKEAAWAVPFLIFSVPTLAVSYLLYRVLGRSSKTVKGAYKEALIRLVGISAVFLAAIMGVFVLTLWLGLNSLIQACAVGSMALVLVFAAYRLMGSSARPVLHDRDLLIMYISAAPILYTLWFFGFWAMMVINDATNMGLPGAALFAGFFGIASIIGYPLGGWLGDRRSPRGRKRGYVASCLVVASLVLLLAYYLGSGGHDLVILGTLVFVIGVIFAAMQTLHMSLTSDLAPPNMLGQTFGMWNLVAEIGALMSPVISGTLRDLTGDWTLAIVVDAGLLIVSAVMVLFIGKGAGSKHRMGY